VPNQNLEYAKQPCFSLSGQVPKIVKDEESIIMPSARNNNSDEEEYQDNIHRTIEQRSLSPTLKQDSSKP
jgi:hypothetical protein